VQADFTAAPTSGLVPLVVVFTNTSTGDYDRSWWDFGDRTTSTLPSPTHTFGTLGAHTVTLRVAGPGGSDIETRPAYIEVEGLWLYLPVVVRGVGEG
jgi:PKD repeat protein